MTNQVQLWNWDGNPIRTVLVDGQAWWVAADVCSALAIVNGSDALVRLEADEKGVGIVDTHGGPQRMTIVSEPGLYALILKSRKPDARKFQRWVTHDVLPSIRKTGQFQLPDTEALAKMLAASPRSELLKIAAHWAEEAEKAQAEVKALTPRALGFDAIGDAVGLHSMDEAAKILGTGPIKLFALLREKNILKHNNLPYQEHIDAGRFKVIEKPYNHNGEQKLYARTFVTGKGLTWLQLALTGQTSFSVARS